MRTATATPPPPAGAEGHASGRRPAADALRMVLRLLLVLAPLALIVLTFRSVNLARALDLARGIGPRAFLILIPYVIIMLFDTLGWQLVLARLGRALPFKPLLAIRTAVEALTMSFSGGSLVADGLSPFLLKRSCGVPPTDTIASVTIRKCLLMLSQSIVQGLGVVLGFKFLTAISPTVLHGRGVPVLLLAASLALLGIALYFVAAILSGNAVARLHATLGRIPSRWLQAKLAGLEPDFEAVDRDLSRAGLALPRLLFPLLLYAGVWLLESVESYLMLRLLGVRVGFVTVWAVVPAIVLLRQIVFFFPGGLGLQEISYLAFFRAAGFPEPTNLAAAFSLLKRSREVIWIATGSITMSLLGGRPRPA